MINITLIQSISREVRKWREQNNSISLQKKSDWQSAILYLSQAILETKKYISNNSIKDKQEESRISELWNQAHQMLKVVDNELASRCFAKAIYWCHPEEWDSQKITNSKIKLESMIEELNKLQYEY